METKLMPSCEDHENHVIGCFGCHAVLYAFVVNNKTVGNTQNKITELTEENLILFLQSFNRELQYGCHNIIQKLRKEIQEYFFPNEEKFYMNGLQFYIVINDNYNITSVLIKSMFRSCIDPTRKTQNGEFMFHPFNWRNMQSFCNKVWILKNTFRKSKEVDLMI